MPVNDANDPTRHRDVATRTRSPLDDATRHRVGPAQPRALERALEPGGIVRRRFVLERLIGSGGMGQVWKAKDLVSEQAQDPNPYVALKLLNADFEADPTAFVALQRETKKAQELAHPNVVTVYSFDIDDGGSGRAFMAMELLSGATLDEFARNHPSGVPRAVAAPLVAGMGRGLEYAHKKGLVHSDFKPGNVFVLDSGTPKVLDFGIARAAKLGGIERLHDSFDAGTLGGITLPYASAEMIEDREPHPADDVYALGLVVYELLAGSHPFQRRPATEARDAGLKPARLSGVRRHEWQAILRALEFDRSRRWQDAGDFLRAYEGKSVLARRLAIVALLLGLIAGLFGYQNFMSSRPGVPFESLPADVQAEFRTHMANADGEWRLVEQGNGDESLNAATEYAKAYALHPRNPDATAGLKKSADFIMRRLQGIEHVERLRRLRTVQEISEYYASYPPLLRAMHAAETER